MLLHRPLAHVNVGDRGKEEEDGGNREHPSRTKPVVFAAILLLLLFIFGLLLMIPGEEDAKAPHGETTALTSRKTTKTTKTTNSTTSSTTTTTKAPRDRDILDALKIFGDQLVLAYRLNPATNYIGGMKQLLNSEAWTFWEAHQHGYLDVNLLPATVPWTKTSKANLINLTSVSLGIGIHVGVYKISSQKNSCYTELANKAEVQYTKAQPYTACIIFDYAAGIAIDELVDRGLQYLQFA
ncbi:hypothetical protein MTO96_052096 [Rhipicephalus appendiculatus]